MLINIGAKILNKALSKIQQHRKRIINHNDQVVSPKYTGLFKIQITMYIIPPYWQNKEQNPTHISINVENTQQNPGPIYDKLTEN